MNLLTIAQLAQFSGIKSHTIRAWEQRYGALKPTRTEGNTRTYSSLDLKRLLNIVSLMDSGYKIAELGAMNDEELNAETKKLFCLDKSEGHNHFVFQLISAGVTFNEISFDKILSHCLLRLGVENTYKEVVYPLLKRVGLMWSTDMLPPAQEHFMCNLIRQKLLTAIDSLPTPKENSKKWLLFLPEDEYHEIGLLFAHYFLRSIGENVIYLGSSVPLMTLASAIESVKPDYLMLFFVHQDYPENTDSYLSKIRECFALGTIYISGNEKLISQMTLESNTHWLKSVDDLSSIEE